MSDPRVGTWERAAVLIPRSVTTKNVLNHNFWRDLIGA